MTRIASMWYNGFRAQRGSVTTHNSKEEIKMADTTWAEVKGDTTGRMEFHLEKMDEAIKILEQAGLDVVAKKMRDAHKMIVKDINDRWMPTENVPLVVLVPKDRDKNEVLQGMKMEDMIREMEKIAKKNSRVGDYI